MPCAALWRSSAAFPSTGISTVGSRRHIAVARDPRAIGSHDPPAWGDLPPAIGRRRPRSMVLRLDAGSRLASAGHSVEACDRRACAHEGCAGEGRGFGVVIGAKGLFCLQVCPANRDLDPIENSRGGAFPGDIRAIFRAFSAVFSRTLYPAKLACGAFLSPENKGAGFPIFILGTHWQLWTLPPDGWNPRHPFRPARNPALCVAMRVGGLGERGLSRLQVTGAHRL
jgi:hypothetical protein